MSLKKRWNQKSGEGDEKDSEVSGRAAVWCVLKVWVPFNGRARFGVIHAEL